MIINKNKKLNKKFIIVFIIIVLLFLITILVSRILKNQKQQKLFEEEKKRVEQYTSITDFQSIQEVALYLNCTLIKEEFIENKHVIYLEIPIKLEENGSYNKNYYKNLIQYSAYVLKYKNFSIIDKKNNINIDVVCNEQNNEVITYYINSIENYFDVQENKNNISQITQKDAISVNISSEILKQLVNQKWIYNNVQFGTKETTYRNYDIYFDEGIEVRSVNNKVFNIIFTEKYNSNIINNLNVKSSKQEIINSLGNPDFELGNLFGYKCSELYVFFYNNQISVYRTEQYNSENIANSIKKLNEGLDIKKFIEEVKNEWKDYDKYEYDEQYVLLQYTLKGLCIKYDKSKKGIIVYNNYLGNIHGENNLEYYSNQLENLPGNIYVENKNLVFENEIERINSLDDASKIGNYKTNIILNISKECKIYTQKVNGMYKVRFISINKDFPNSQLREYISMGIWLDNYNFIYSISGKGIYMYNVKNCTYKTVCTGNNSYMLKKLENNVLYYDDISVAIN